MAEPPILAIPLPIAEVVQRLSRSCPRVVQSERWQLFVPKFSRRCPGLVQELSRSFEERLVASAAVRNAGKHVQSQVVLDVGALRCVVRALTLLCSFGVRLSYQPEIAI